MHLIELKLQELFLISYLNHSNDKKRMDIKSEELQKIKRLKQYLDLHYNKNPKIKDLCKMFYLNELKIKNGFKSMYEITIHQYILKLKMIESCNLLRENLSVNDIAIKSGFKNSSHFISSFKKYYGVTPKKVKL